MALRRIACLVAAMVLGVATVAGAQTATSNQHGGGGTIPAASEDQSSSVLGDERTGGTDGAEDAAQQQQPPAPERPDGEVAVEKLPDGLEIVPGEIVINYKDEAAKDKAAKSLRGKAKVKKVEDVPDTFAESVVVDDLKVKKGKELKKGLDAKIAEIENDPAVLDAHYNRVYRAAWSPNDSLFRNGTQKEVRKIRGPAAWDIGQGNAVRIGMVDGGYNDGHADFNKTVGSTEKVVAQHDFVDDDRRADDVAGHGSSVASVASAKTDNGMGMAGACPHCHLVVAKVFDAGGYTTDAWIANGMNWAVDNGARALNLSFGGFSHGNSASTSMVNAVDYAADKNCQVVAAAGNHAVNGDPSGPYGAFYPAALDGVVAVGALDDDGTTPAVFSNYGDYIDVMAPGVTITGVGAPGRAHQTVSGTSFAAPYVTGLSGMLYGRGLARAGDRAYWIEQGAVDVGPVGEDGRSGHGRVDMRNSMAKVVAAD